MPGSGEGFASGHSIETFVDYLGDRIAKAPAGDCALTSPALGDWASGGEAGGRSTCYTDPASGDAVAYWSYGEDRVLIKAINQRGDVEALREFVISSQRFFRP